MCSGRIGARSFGHVEHDRASSSETGLCCVIWTMVTADNYAFIFFFACLDNNLIRFKFSTAFLSFFDRKYPNTKNF